MNQNPNRLLPPGYSELTPEARAQAGVDYVFHSDRLKPGETIEELLTSCTAVMGVSNKAILSLLAHEQIKLPIFSAIVTTPGAANDTVRNQALVRGFHQSSEFEAVARFYERTKRFLTQGELIALLGHSLGREWLTRLIRPTPIADPTLDGYIDGDANASALESLGLKGFVLPQKGSALEMEYISYALYALTAESGMILFNRDLLKEDPRYRLEKDEDSDETMRFEVATPLKLEGDIIRGTVIIPPAFVQTIP